MPEVHNKITGVPEALAIPRAKNAEHLSSIWTKDFIFSRLSLIPPDSSAKSVSQEGIFCSSGGGFSFDSGVLAPSFRREIREFFPFSCSKKGSVTTESSVLVLRSKLIKGYTAIFVPNCQYYLNYLLLNNFYQKLILFRSGRSGNFFVTIVQKMWLPFQDRSSVRSDSEMGSD